MLSSIDLVKFRVVWWFKNLGKGSSDPVTLLLEDIRDRCVDSIDSKVPRPVGWDPPPANVLMFNVDGSARGSPAAAGIGGVLRDSNGKVLCSFSTFVGCMDSNSAEIYAIHRACMLLASATHLPICNVTIVSDSKSVVSWCNGKDFGNIMLVDLVYDIRSFLHSWDGLSIKFMYRGLNSFTDGLAKLGSSRMGDRVEWGVP